MRIFAGFTAAAILTGAATGPVSGQQRPIVVKLATLAPNGSSWHQLLQDMGARWSEASNGLVQLRIYPGGVAGEEADILRKMRIGQLHAGSISAAGLTRISTAVHVLAIPMAIDSWEKLERVRQVMGPRLEALFEEEGYILLNWGDVGWARFFFPTPEVSVEAARKHKFIAWSNDTSTDLWRAAGFQMVVLNMSDILPGLQTGMVDAIGTTPLLVLSNQWFPAVPYMLDMPWAPVVGATLMDARTWRKIPEDLRPELLRIAREMEEELKAEIARLEEEAIAAMVERGLHVIKPTEEILRQWRTLIEAEYPRIRGHVVPEDWFDEALRIVSGGK